MNFKLKYFVVFVFLIAPLSTYFSPFPVAHLTCPIGGIFLHLMMSPAPVTSQVRPVRSVIDGGHQLMVIVLPITPVPARRGGTVTDRPHDAGRLTPRRGSH